MGCLVRLMDSLERDYVHNATSRIIYSAINHRENLNGRLPYGDPNLEAATAQTSTLLYGVLRGNLIVPEKVKKEFLYKLDLEFKNILGEMNADSNC